MKISNQNFPGSLDALGGRQGGFTLPETMITMTIFMIVIGGVLSSHIFGLRLFDITKGKLLASDQARLTVSKLVDDVRSAHVIRIGQGDASSFTDVPINTVQRGTALQIYPTTDTNTFVRYFWDSQSTNLKRLDSATAKMRDVAVSINSLVFTSEDYAGNVYTNNQYNHVIGMSLTFYQLQYPLVQIGPSNYYDFYQLRTKITRRI